MPFTNDAVVFGILMLSLGFVFYTESRDGGFWKKFYKIIPGLLMCYFIPALIPAEKLNLLLKNFRDALV